MEKAEIVEEMETIEVSEEQLKSLHEFTIEEILYIDNKYPDEQSLPAKIQAFVHPISLVPCALITFDNGRSGYISRTKVEEAEKRQNATDYRSQA